MKQALLLVVLLVAGVAAGRGAAYVYGHYINPPPAPVVEGDFSAEVADRPVLFMTSTCPFCKQAVAYLDAHGVAYEKVVVDASDAARARYERLHAKTVPVLLTRSARITGFRPEAYARYLPGTP